MIFLDFEASAAMGGFPIEVGFCSVGPNREMHSAAKLIRHEEWLDELQRWDWQASQIHKIDRSHLMEFGEPPHRVMAWLNKALAGAVAVADSPMDMLWLRELVTASGVTPAFGLTGDISVAFSGPEIGMEASEAAVTQLCPKTHRADQDARHLATRYVMSLTPSASVHRLFVKGDGYERRSLNGEEPE